MTFANSTLFNCKVSVVTQGVSFIYFYQITILGLLLNSSVYYPSTAFLISSFQPIFLDVLNLEVNKYL